MTDEDGTELFDRWLAHREGRTSEPGASEYIAPGARTAGDSLADAQPPVAPVVPEHAATLPHTIFFKPRTATKRMLGLLLVPLLGATAVAVVWAWHDRTYLSYGITAVIALVTGVVWATRASAAPVRMTLHGSELQIVRDGSRAVFDLAAGHTPIEMSAEPGDRRWRVLIRRRSLSPYVIDATMVDPVEFTRVLRFYRPGI